MNVFTTLPAWQPLLLCCAFLVLKMGAVAFTTANVRRKARVVVNPEDTQVNPGSVAASDEAPQTLRVKRAHLNDVENIPGFMVLATLFTLSGCSALAGWAYFGTYVVARTLHTIFYLNAAQPWRTIAFAVGQITQLGIIVQLALLAF